MTLAIILTFTLLTAVVAATTALVADRRLGHMQISSSVAPSTGDKTTQQVPNPDFPSDDKAAPDARDGASTMVTVEGDGTGGFSVKSTKVDARTRNTLVATAVVPIVVFGLLAAAATWLITTSSHRRLSETARQIGRSSGTMSRRPIAIERRDDEATVIADAYNGMLDDLNAGIERERRFIADASHELKNPLATIRTALEVPLDNGMFDERSRPFVDAALAADESGIEIVTHLLEVAKVQNLRKTQLDDVVVSQSLDTALNRYRDTLASRELRLSTRVEPVSIKADGLLLTQMFDNLINNAIQYNRDDGGSIDISLSPATKDENVGCVFTIANTGAALDETNVKGLTEPFNRGANSRLEQRATNTANKTKTATRHARSMDNHGLGLSIVDEIVSLHGGRLKLEPHAAGGLTVTVFLPGTPDAPDMPDDSSSKTRERIIRRRRRDRHV